MMHELPIRKGTSPDPGFNDLMRAFGNIFLSEMHKPDAAKVWQTLATAVAVYAACDAAEATTFLICNHRDATTPRDEDA